MAVSVLSRQLILDYDERIEAEGRTGFEQQWVIARAATTLAKELKPSAFSLFVAAGRRIARFLHADLTADAWRRINLF